MAPWKYFTMPPPSPSRHNLVDVVKQPIPSAVILAEVQRLLAEGADVNQTNGDGQTALLWVSNMNDGVAIATALIEAGADISVANKEGKTALDLAKEMENDEIVNCFENQ
jgi:ankyrin repeat protein